MDFPKRRYKWMDYLNILDKMWLELLIRNIGTQFYIYLNLILELKATFKNSTDAVTLTSESPYPLYSTMRILHFVLWKSCRTLSSLKKNTVSNCIYFLAIQGETYSNTSIKIIIIRHAWRWAMSMTHDLPMPNVSSVSMKVNNHRPGPWLLLLNEVGMEFNSVRSFNVNCFERKFVGTW
jgi:hypothetical protein